MSTSSQKVLQKYRGEIYFPERIEYDQLINSSSKPEDHVPWEIPQISMISDEINKSLFFIGDFNGNDDWYPFALKIFIYKDGKALGNIRYVSESGWNDEKIEARFKE